MDTGKNMTKYFTTIQYVQNNLCYPPIREKSGILDADLSDVKNYDELTELIKEVLLNDIDANVLSISNLTRLS